LLGRPTLRRRPLAHQLDRRLVRFGARIAQEHSLGEAGGVHQLLRQAQRWLGVEHVAAMPKLMRLLGQRGKQIRILMTQCIHCNACAEIDVVTLLGIPHARTLASIEHQLARLVDR